MEVRRFIEDNLLKDQAKMVNFIAQAACMLAVSCLFQELLKSPQNLFLTFGFKLKHILACKLAGQKQRTR